MKKVEEKEEAGRIGRKKGEWKKIRKTTITR